MGRARLPHADRAEQLSQCLKELGRLDEAYDVLMGPNEDAPYIAQSVLGPAHPKTIQMLDRMRQIGKAPKGGGQGASGLARHREQMAEHREAFALAVVRESSAFNLNEPSVGGDALAGLREDSVDATVEADEETSARRTLTNDRGRRLGLDVTRRTGSGSVLTPHVALREKAEAQRQSRLKEKMRKARRKMSAGAASVASPPAEERKEKLAWTARRNLRLTFWRSQWSALRMRFCQRNLALPVRVDAWLTTRPNSASA